MASGKKTYSPQERRRKRRRFNLILYAVSALLILTGIIIIVSDTTYFFDDAGKFINRIVTGETPVPMPTLPAGPARTANPNPTPRIIDWTEEQTPPPNQGGAQPYGTPVPYSPYAPKCVYFSQYNRSCPVDPVGYNGAGQMDVVRTAFRAGWFFHGGDPVHGGNTLIAGHNKYSGKLGYFAIVKDSLKEGDDVIVEMNNGEYAYYKVSSIGRYEYDKVPEWIMNVGGDARLTLITCYGDYSSAIGTSRHRVIAICYPVEYGA